MRICMRQIVWIFAYFHRFTGFLQMHFPQHSCDNSLSATPADAEHAIAQDHNQEDDHHYYCDHIQLKSQPSNVI